MLDNPPLVQNDFATHWAEAWSMAHFLDDGHLWGYDPNFMAGYPGNALYDLDKLTGIATWLLSKTGLSLELSYNLVMIALLVVAPLLVYPAARWFGLSIYDAFVAQLAGLAVWYVDPLVNWFWEGGPFVFLSTVYVALLVLAAIVRLCDTRASAGIGPWLIWFVVGPLLFWLHAMAFILLLVPLTVFVLQTWRGLNNRRRLLVALWPPLVLLVNLPWIIPFLRFRSLRTSSAQHLQGGLSALGSDLLGIGGEGSVGEDGTGLDILAVRWIVLIAGFIGLWALYRTNRSLLAVIAGVVTGFVLSYGAVHLPNGGDLQPYRYIVQATVWSTLGVAAGFRLARRVVVRFDDSSGRSPLFRFVATIALALWIVWALNAVIAYRPEVVGGSPDRWHGPTDAALATCVRLQGASGRVLADDWRISTLLPWCAGVEVLNGPAVNNPIEYAYANASHIAWLGQPYGTFDQDTWQEAVDAYDVRWLIVNHNFQQADWFTLASFIEDNPATANSIASYGPYELYAVERNQPSDQASAGYDRIQLNGVPPGVPLLLRYHWLDGLTAVPESVMIEPYYVPGLGDPTPFIMVTSPTASDVVICLQDRCD